jgi:hypothetical protein
MQGVAVPTQPGQKLAVHVGDHVRVQTKAGQSHSFAVTQIQPDALEGKNIRISFKDIATIEVRRMDQSRKAELTGGVVVGVLVVAVVAGLVVLLTHGIAFMPSGPS